MGPSCARNMGIDFIKLRLDFNIKNYIFFVDSDDSLMPNALEYIADSISRKNIDLLVINNINIMHSLDRFHYSPFAISLENRFFTSKELFGSINNAFIASTFSFIFDAKYLLDKNLYFIPNIFYEDIVFCTQLVLYINSIYIDSKAIYNYRLSPNSIMRGSMTTDKRKKSAYSFYVIANWYYKMYNLYIHDNVLGDYFFKNFLRSIKDTLRELQFIGYFNLDGKCSIFKSDIKDYLPYISERYKFCFYFPRIYGLPKRIRLFFSKLFV